MTDRFAGELWQGSADIYQAILAHPFLAGLTDGSLPQDAFVTTWCSVRPLAAPAFPPCPLPPSARRAASRHEWFGARMQIGSEKSASFAGTSDCDRGNVCRYLQGGIVRG